MRVNVNLDTQMLAREERCKVVFACGCAAAEPSGSDSDVLTGAPHLYPSYHQRTVSMLLKLSKAFIKVVKYRKITIFMTPNVNEYIGTSRWLNDLK